MTSGFAGSWSARERDDRVGLPCVERHGTGCSLLLRDDLHEVCDTELVEREKSVKGLELGRHV